MAKKKMKHVPLPVLGAAFVPAVDGVTAIMSGDVKGGVNNLIYNYTGVAQGKFSLSRVLETYAPIGGAVVVHKFLGPRVNPYLPSWFPFGL